MAISSKHQAFIEEYLICWNATEAYHRVYAPKSRTTSASNGFELLRNTEISEVISRRLAESAMSANEVLMRLASHARGSMGDFVKITPVGPQFDFEAASMADQLHLVKKLKTKTRTVIVGGDEKDEESSLITEVDIEFELYDAQAALEKIGRHHKLFADKLDVNLTTIPEITADQRAQADKELGEWQNKKMRSAEISNGENAQ